jgi:hypothetical protein
MQGHDDEPGHRPTLDAQRLTLMSGRSPIPGRVYLGGMTHLLWCIRPLPEELNLNN